MPISRELREARRISYPILTYTLRRRRGIVIAATYARRWNGDSHGRLRATKGWLFGTEMLL